MNCFPLESPFIYQIPIMDVTCMPVTGVLVAIRRKSSLRLIVEVSIWQVCRLSLLGFINSSWSSSLLDIVSVICRLINPFILCVSVLVQVMYVLVFVSMYLSIYLSTAAIATASADDDDDDVVDDAHDDDDDDTDDMRTGCFKHLESICHLFSSFHSDT